MNPIHKYQDIHKTLHPTIKSPLWDRIPAQGAGGAEVQYLQGEAMAEGDTESDYEYEDEDEEEVRSEEADYDDDTEEESSIVPQPFGPVPPPPPASLMPTPNGGPPMKTHFPRSCLQDPKSYYASIRDKVYHHPKGS